MFNPNYKDHYRFLCFIQVDAVERYVISLQQTAPSEQWVCRNLTPVRNYMDATRSLFHPHNVRDLIGLKDEDADSTWIRFQQVYGEPLCPIKAMEVLPQEFVDLPNALTSYFRYPLRDSPTLIDLEEIRIIRRIGLDSNVYEVKYIAPRPPGEYANDYLIVYKAGLGIRLLNWHRHEPHLIPSEQAT